jgi:hypothetical protein
LRFAAHLLPRAGSWLSRPSNILFAGTSVAAFYYVLLLHGFTPGRDQAPNMALYGAGMIKCLHDQGLASLTQWCNAVGYPVGAPFLTGLPQIYLGWLFSYVPGIDAWVANSASAAFFDGLAMVGGFVLMRRWGAGRWIAVYASTLYLTSVSILRLTGLAYTFTGYVLLPFYLAAGVFLMDMFGRGRRWRSATGMVALTLLMVFTDGYSFFGAALLLCITAFWRLMATRFSSSEAWWTMAVLAASIALSAFLYTVYVPGSAYEQTGTGLGFFRFLGLDLATLVIPVDTLWYPRLLGIDGTTLPLWGDGTNASNYVGFSTLALVLWLMVVGRRRLTRTTRVEVWALFVAGAVALVLSFGPALKVYEVARDISPAWDVPASMTTLPLPTSWLYENVPGLTEMRATYRWFLVTRLAMILTACLALSRFWRATEDRAQGGPSTGGSSSSRALSGELTSRTRGWRAAATVLVAMVLALETAVDIPNQLQFGKTYAQKVDKIRDGVVPEAGALLGDHERVLILPTMNDFTADVVIPMAGAVSYNTGGDKNYGLARAAWPKSIEGAATAYGSTGEKRAYCVALRGDVHAIVLPYISFHYGSLMTVDRSAEDRAMKRHALSVAGDGRFTSDSGTWMTVLRSSGKPC